MQIAKLHLLMEAINSVQMLVINEMQGFSNNYKKIMIILFWVGRGPDRASLAPG